MPRSDTPSNSSPLFGLMFAVAIAALSWLLVAALGLAPSPFDRLPISAMLVAILAGLVLAGFAARRPALKPGLDIARGPVLKTAVALIGLRLALGDLGTLGWQALPLVVLMLIAGLALVAGFARLLGVHARLAVLLATGTAICGASAIAATAPGIRARSDETLYAVACIALIGLTATMVYPWLLEAFLDNPVEIGFVLGAAVHDTAQVTAAALLHEQTWGSETTVTSATVAKLMRNLSMLLVIPLVVAWFNRGSDRSGGKLAVPLFIVAFVLLSGLRTLGDALLGSDQVVWNAILALASEASLFGFTMAMAALAMGIRPAELKRQGWRPAVAAGLAAAAMLALAIVWVRAGIGPA